MGHLDSQGIWVGNTDHCGDENCPICGPTDAEIGMEMDVAPMGKQVTWSWDSTLVPEYEDLVMIGGTFSGEYRQVQTGNYQPVLVGAHVYIPLEFTVSSLASPDETVIRILLEQQYLEYLKQYSPMNPDGSPDIINGIFKAAGAAL